MREEEELYFRFCQAQAFELLYMSVSFFHFLFYIYIIQYIFKIIVVKLGQAGLD